MYGKKKSPTQKRSCYKMKPKSPMLRALKGDQDKLPPKIQGFIKAAPTKMYKNKKAKSNKPCPGCSTICPSCRSGKSPAKNYKKGYYGA